MEDSIFKKAIIISLLGHLTLFSLFSFSFGKKLASADYGVLAFWGQIFNNSDLKAVSLNNPAGLGGIFAQKGLIIPKTSAEIKNPLSELSLKPKVYLSFGEKKQDFANESLQKLDLPKSSQPVIMFHPLLPYHFTLFFNDRQIVHIELMFNIVSGDRINPIIIKRKISSGNLEADLLTMRYIGHYLFIQQARFPPDNWHTVKIDLSARENY
jgi:hypothetical protein